VITNLENIFYSVLKHVDLSL